MKKIFAVFLLTLISGVIFAQNSASRRYALIIGNANYQRIEKLNNTVNDARDISAALREIGYQVDLKTDLNQYQMIDAVDAFAARLAADRSSEGFFWYAGHAVQIRDENYLLPIDITVDSESRVRAGAFSLNSLLETLEGTRNKANVIILDSCRDNPLPTRSRGTGTRGLSVINDMPSDLFVMFSTAPGNKAEDGAAGRRNSPFAEAFLKYIKSSEPLSIVAAHVANETLTLTDQRQRPFYRGSIISDVYYTLNPAGRGPVQTAQPTPAAPPPAPAAPAPQPTPTAASRPAPAPQPAIVPPPAPVPAPQAVVNPFVQISGGVFAMGGNSTYDKSRHVAVSSFNMGRSEVTQREYQQVMGANPSMFKGDNLPVEQVSWYDAVEYCNRRSQIEGLTPVYTIDKNIKDADNTSSIDNVKWVVTWDRNANGYRLPTEAEWEFACRAGTTTVYNIGTNTPAGLSRAGWYENNSGNRTHPVMQKSPNTLGLYDMHGNVTEWCWDWYASYPDEGEVDPAGASSGLNRISRGGSWGTSAESAGSSYRLYYNPSYKSSSLGFRVVRQVPRSESAIAALTASLVATPLPSPAAPARPQQPAKPKREVSNADFLRSFGFSVGTSFSIPGFIGTVQGSISPLRNTFLDFGLELGLVSGVPDTDYYSLYPFAHLGAFAPFENKGGWYVGAGMGYLLANYTFPEGKVQDNVIALDLCTGFIIADIINISYNVRTDFSSVGNKLAIGYIKRFY